MPGPRGPAGFTSTTIVTASVSVPVGGTLTQSVTCPVSVPRAIGGGFEVPDAYSNVMTVLQDRPLGGGEGWAVRMRNGGSSLPLPYAIWAVCAA